MELSLTWAKSGGLPAVDKECGEWPTFERQFRVSLVARVGLDLLALTMYLPTTKGAMGEISALGFTAAFLVGCRWCSTCSSSSRRRRAQQDGKRGAALDSCTLPL
jgi:hypothetical protein